MTAGNDFGSEGAVALGPEPGKLTNLTLLDLSSKWWHLTVSVDVCQCGRRV